MQIDTRDNLLKNDLDFRKEIGAKRVDIERKKQALATGTILHLPPTDLETRFL